MKSVTAFKILSAAMLAIGLTASAFGLTITAATAAAASGGSNEPSSATDVKNALGLSYNLTELYWADADAGDDGGIFEPSYRATFSASDTNVSIDGFGTPIISGYNSLFLLALADYDASPIFAAAAFFQALGEDSRDWKIFNITGWNGTDNIVLDSIFPNAGDSNKYDIGKIKIFGGNAPQQPNNGVPDSGSTALLLGSALLGLALYSRRKSA